MKTILIAGLGNPGEKFEKTRHNAGFAFLEYFRKSRRDKFYFSEWNSIKKMKSEVSLGKDGDKKIILMKPGTFMNLSGEAVLAVKKYYKVKLEDILIIHDEIDLPLGRYKFSTDSSSAGHQGVENIIDILGTKNFTRLRIGIDNRIAKKIATEKYVLGKFNKNEFDKIKIILDEMSQQILPSQA